MLRDAPLFLIRPAQAKDLRDVFRLANHLDSYNLPADRRRLAVSVEDSRKSFLGQAVDVARQRYIFVLEDLAARQVVGCSLVIAKHGTPGLPHLYMTSFVEKRHSRTLNKTVQHRCLRLGATEDGPTEVGGLVLLPSYRGRPEKLGHWLSYVRFLYIASHLDRFQKYLLAEYLPKFLKKNQSPFWDYFGQKFTGLSYRQADRLSIDNKEFILSLFPRTTLYQELFPKSILDYLGQVGNPSRPAAQILRKIGFSYLHQIEPFDGGPYYGTLTRAVKVVRRARQLQVIEGPATRGPLLLFLAEGARGPRALALRTRTRGASVGLPKAARDVLGLAPGDWVWSCPLRF